uniref:Uncharacterized protein n=1 Tax=Knipowitschia caucasica TaxID=637954 RepID=A0AAV2KVF7_KNICA
MTSRYTDVRALRPYLKYKYTHNAPLSFSRIAASRIPLPARSPSAAVQTQTPHANTGVLTLTTGTPV